MKFLANENIPRVSVLLIRDAGFDIVSVGEEFAGISDPEVISFANTEGRTIITFDSDYGELIFKHGLKVDQGVIYLRVSTSRPKVAAEIVIPLVEKTDIDFSSALTVVDQDKVRQRKY